MRILIAFLWLLHWLPLPVLGRIGNAVGWLMYYAIPKRRKIALTNLRLCLPELSELERIAIAKRHFMGYSRSILERSLIWWASIPRLRRLIHIEPAVPQAEMESGPTILLCPHFVCLDVAGVAARVIPVSTIYSPQKNQAFDRLLRYGRERFGPVRLFTREDGIKPILRALRDGLPYFMLPDMDFDPHRHAPAGGRHQGEGDPGDRDLPAELPGLPRGVLSCVGRLPGRRHGGRHAPDERIHRRTGAREPGRVLLDAQAF
jgi:KDO2-lipid IV(A) lauroyltransferase